MATAIANRRQARAVVVAVLLAQAALLSSCQQQHSGRLAVHHRVLEDGGEVVATIGDETRYLLSEVPHTVLLVPSEQTVPPSGELVMERKLPRRLKTAGRIVVAAKASLDGRSWRQLPRSVAVVRSGRPRSSIEMRLRFPDVWRGQRVRLQVVGWVPPAGGRTRQRSGVISVPRGAVLEVGAGLLGVGRDNGEIALAVSVCADSECEPILEASLAAAAERWQDWRLPLDDWAGREVELQFESGFASGETSTPMFAVWSRPMVLAPAAAKQRRPNVILLSIDTLRGDYLSSYGHPRDTAPKLREWFEKEGVLFENVVAAATTTGPSHMTMFTSLTPTVHGITARPAVARPAPITLAEVMRAHGYATGAVTEDGPLHARWGFSRGFDSYAENKSADVMLPEGHVAATFAKAEEWLRRNADRPFFLFLHTFEVHYPYTPPARYAAMFGGGPRVPGLPSDYAPELYEREIRYVDDQLDAFMGKLRGAGLLEDTIFVVTSDHGEEFLEHGAIGHGAYLHKEGLEVPLLVRGPSVAKGRRIAAPVGHTDLLPTILDLVGLPPLEVAMGRNLGPLLRGEVASVDDAPLYSEAWYATAMTAGGATHLVEQPAIAVRQGSRKLVRSQRPDGFGYEYYDLAHDPDERRDLYPEKAEEVADLRDLLASYEPLMGGVRRRSDLARANFGTSEPAVEEAEIDIDPAVREKLRALGYVE